MTGTRGPLNAFLDLAEIPVRNAQNGMGWLDVTDTALAGMADNLRRVGELALQGANASVTGSTSAALATEVAQIAEGLLGQANTT